MKTVIYNPNCIDSILTAAFLQTTGATTYANTELLPQNPGLHIWLGVIPSLTHFRGGKHNPNTRHVCYTYGHKSYASRRHAMRNSFYANNLIAEMEQEAIDKNQHEPIRKSHGSFVLLDQVCAIEEIVNPEQMFLSWLIQNYYKTTNQDVVAITTLNVANALEALKSREGFTPVKLPEKGIMDDDLIRAHTLFSAMRLQTERVFANASGTNTVKTNTGTRRVIVTYEHNNWWFHRRSLGSKDIGFNINMAITGTHISATDFFQSDIEESFNVREPNLVVV